MSVRSIGVFVALFFLFAAVACGGDDDDSPGGASGGSTDAPVASDGGSQDGDDDSTSDEEEESDDDSQSTDSSGGSGSEIGTLVAGGQRYSVSEVRRCEPFFGGDSDLDLQAVANDGVILFVVLNSPSAALTEQEVTIQGGGLGVFTTGAYSVSGGDPWFDSSTDAELLAPPFSVAGDHVSGLTQLADPRGSGETLDVSFEIPIPADIIDC